MASSSSAAPGAGVNNVGMSSEQAQEVDGWLSELQGSGEGLVRSIDRIMGDLPTPHQLANAHREPVDMGRVMGDFNVLVRHLKDANEVIEESDFGSFVFRPVGHVDQPAPPGAGRRLLRWLPPADPAAASLRGPGDTLDWCHQWVGVLPS